MRQRRQKRQIDCLDALDAFFQAKNLSPVFSVWENKVIRSHSISDTVQTSI